MPLSRDDERRHEIGADLAHTVLAEASRRLAAAVADYETGLDRHASLHELQFLDHEMDDARRTLEVAHRVHATAGCGHPDHADALPGAEPRTGC